MTYQVIRQPSGDLAIFSTYTDTIVMWDATRDDITGFFVNLAASRANRETEHILDRVLADDPGAVYHQFAKTWTEALEMDREHGGEAHKEARP